MKFMWNCLVILVLSSSLLAQTTASKPKVRRVSAVTAADVAAELQGLRDTLAAQQQQIEQLRQELQRRDQQWQQSQEQLQQKLSQAQSAATEAQSKAAEAQSGAASQHADSGKLQNDVADMKANMTNAAVGTQDEQKRASALEDLLGRFRFNGDARVRYEPFFQAGTPQRHRERIRLRFGVDSKLGEDFTAGLYVASGAITDPTTTNESFTNFFERKTIAWDRGWITFQPHNHKWLQLTGGKFAYTWQRTPQTFDSDLNPEGFSQKLSFDMSDKIVKNVSLTGIQMLFNEVSRGTDSFAAGGQVSSKLQLGSRWTATPSFTILNWRNANAILNAPASVIGSNALTCTAAEPPVCTFASGPFAPNGITNATVTVNGTRQFASQFNYADFIWDNSIKTGWARFPWRVLLEYEDNLRAASNASHLYLIESSLGQLKEKNDMLFGYAWARQEQDSVIASFVESDQRAPTNILQHRFYWNWNVRKNTTAAYTLWVGRTLDSTLPNAVLATGTLPGQKEPYLKRMQFDLIYKF